MTLYPWGAKPGLWRTSRQRRSPKLGWHDVRFVCDRAQAEDLCDGGARLPVSLHSARILWVKRAKTPG